MPIRLMIVDDHKLMREGLKMILSEAKDIIVVAEAADGEDAIKKARNHNPDVILLDIIMPKIDGIETLRRMKDFGIGGKIIILSGQVGKKHILDSIKLGASGYITKDSDISRLISVIRDVHNGYTYLEPKLGNLLKQHIEDHNVDDIDVDKIESLSKREYEILVLVAKGYSNKQIANELYISEKTVKNHITSMFKKLEVDDRVQAVIFAYKNGIV